jgi:hypothetical protein
VLCCQNSAFNSLQGPSPAQLLLLQQGQLHVLCSSARYIYTFTADVCNQSAANLLREGKLKAVARIAPQPRTPVAGLDRLHSLAASKTASVPLAKKNEGGQLKGPQGTLTPVTYFYDASSCSWVCVQHKVHPCLPIELQTPVSGFCCVVHRPRSCSPWQPLSAHRASTLASSLDCELCIY